MIHLKEDNFHYYAKYVDLLRITFKDLPAGALTKFAQNTYNVKVMFHLQQCYL